MGWHLTIRDELSTMAPLPTRPNVPIRLDANESPYGLPEEIIRAASERLALRPWHRYPEKTEPQLLDAAAKMCGVPIANVLVMSGMEQMLRTIFYTFNKPHSRETRARIAFPALSPSIYRRIALLHGLALVEFPLKEDFSLDVLAIERQIRGAKPNIMMFCRPNDPTGNCYSREDMMTLIAEHPEIVIIVDETYFPFANDTLVDLVNRHPHLIILRTHSAAGLAGLRLSFLVAHPEMITLLVKGRGPQQMDILAQAAAGFLLTNHLDELENIVRRISEERERLQASLQQIEGVQVWPSQTNFILVRVADGPGVHQALLTRGISVATVDDAAGTLPNCLRITVGTPEENAELLQKLPDAIANPETPPPPAIHKPPEKIGEEEKQEPPAGLPKFF